MKRKHIIYSVLGIVGFLALLQAQNIYYGKKISSFANANGMIIITLANFNENQNAYQGLSAMFGNKSPLGGHIGNIFQRKREIQNQFYLFLLIGALLIGISIWLFYSTYKNPTRVGI